MAASRAVPPEGPLPRAPTFLDILTALVMLCVIAYTSNAFADFLSRPNPARSLFSIVTMLLLFQIFSSYSKRDKVFWLLVAVTTPLCTIFALCLSGLLSLNVFVWLTGFLGVLFCGLVAYLSAFVGETKHFWMQQALILVGIVTPMLTALLWLVSRTSNVYRSSTRSCGIAGAYNEAESDHGVLNFRIGFVLSLCTSSINILFNKTSGSAVFGLPENVVQQEKT